MSEKVFTGACHCGAIALRFATRKAPSDLPLHACQCAFCRRHATRTTSDPDGALTLIVHAAGALNRYEFGLATAQYLICRRCGVYVAAVCPSANGERGLVNVNCLDDRAAFAGTPKPVSYDAEGREARLARRAKNWTPAVWAAPDQG
jgi:hypothetical protein